MNKKSILLFLVFILSCKDPFLKKCDDLCNFVSECTKQNLLKEQYKLLERAYPYCINACMMYYQEISECYRKDKNNSCKEAFDCMFPVLLNK